jgi:hypothetical protein
MASPDRTMETPQLPFWYFRPLYEQPENIYNMSQFFNCQTKITQDYLIFNKYETHYLVQNSTVNQINKWLI